MILSKSDISLITICYDSNCNRSWLLFFFFFTNVYSNELYQLMAVTRSNICKNGVESISRWGAIMYYASIFLYFWVLSTPAVSFVFGSYLYICINWFNLHYDKPFPHLGLLIIRHSLDFTSNEMVILKFSPLQLIR